MKTKILMLVVLCCLTLCLFSCTNNTPAETEPRVRGEIVDTGMVMNKQFGMFVTSVSTADEFVVDAEVRKQGDGVKVMAYSDGTTVLTAYDWWGNTATVEVVVENSKITAMNVTALEGDVANVRFFGACGDGKTDDTAAIQKAIDSLKNGGTVYVPAGTYMCSGIILRENTHMRLQGKVDDVKSGYTDAVKAQVESGEYAILKNNFRVNQMMLNHEIGAEGKTGKSNISFIGGMIDFDGALKSGKAQVDVNQESHVLKYADGTGAIFVTYGSGFVFENVIFKDGYNTHFFQITGAKNVHIKDCMFAGYTCKAQTKGQINTINQSRESIQIEHSHSGACPPTKFEEGEFYYCENIKITGCYFGDSDKAGYHLTPIGHHGMVGQATVTGIEISDNVFDNPYFTAMHFPNYVNVDIKNNTFISNKEGFRLGALIDIYMNAPESSYKGKLQGSTNATTTIVSAFPRSHAGIHNINIENNEFMISGESNKRAISVIGLPYKYGAFTVTDRMVQIKGTVYGKRYTGFVMTTNMLSDLTIKGNKIDVSASDYYKDYMIHTSYIICKRKID